MSLGIDWCTGSVSFVLEHTLRFLTDISLSTLIKNRSTLIKKNWHVCSEVRPISLICLFIILLKCKTWISWLDKKVSPPVHQRIFPIYYKFMHDINCSRAREWYDDVTSSTGSAFLSVSLGCLHKWVCWKHVNVVRSYVSVKHLDSCNNSFIENFCEFSEARPCKDR